MTIQAYTDIKQQVKSMNLPVFVERCKPDTMLRKSGAGYIGFCPFHSNVNTPAFSVYLDKVGQWQWKCHGTCDKSGDIIAFVMEWRGVDYKGAIEFFTNGLPLPAKPTVNPQPSKVAIPSARVVFRPPSPKPSNLATWQAYAPTIESYIVNGYGLTTGRLNCDHDRLITPLTVNGVTLAMKGRAWGCDCGKWTQEAKPSPVIYNGAILLNKFIGGEYDHLIPPTKERLLLGDTIFQGHGAIENLTIVENLTDCLLLQASLPMGHGVVAVGGKAIKAEAMTNLVTAIKRAGVKVVMVSWDRPSETNGKDMERAWVNARDGLKGCGAEVIRYNWGAGEWKDWGEWLKATRQQQPRCQHNDIAIVDGAHGVYVQCKTCGASFATLDGVTS